MNDDVTDARPSFGSQPTPRDQLIEHLVADLAPIQRLRNPALRALGWSALVLVFAAVLACKADLPSIAGRLSAVPDMWLAMAGSTLTAGLAALAAFELSLPDRSRLWALLPLPAIALWIGASGMGCARSWLVPGTREATWGETRLCLTFIAGCSVPLSLVTFAMLRHGRSLSPALTGATAGLAVAAAAATLLNFFHPYDATLDDLVVHAVAVAIVVAANQIGGAVLWSARHSLAGVKRRAAARAAVGLNAS